MPKFMQKHSEAAWQIPFCKYLEPNYPYNSISMIFICWFLRNVVLNRLALVIKYLLNKKKIVLKLILGWKNLCHIKKINQINLLLIIWQNNLKKNFYLRTISFLFLSFNNSEKLNLIVWDFNFTKIYKSIIIFITIFIFICTFITSKSWLK